MEENEIKQKISYKCPSCGNQSLFIDAIGKLTCSVIGCKDPCAFDDMVNTRPTTLLEEGAVAHELSRNCIDGSIRQKDQCYIDIPKTAKSICSRFALPKVVLPVKMIQGLSSDPIAEEGIKMYNQAIDDITAALDRQGIRWECEG